MVAKAVTLFVVASVLLICVAALEPIWLSPTDTAIETAEDVAEQFSTKGAWVNNTHGAGGRAFGPAVLMDSKGTLWIFGGENIDVDGNAYLFAVWNYDPKTDLYRWVAGPNDYTNPRNPGELRVPSDDAHPGGLNFVVATIDRDDNIWFMSYDYSGEFWRFNTSSWQFTRMQGLYEDNTNAPVHGEQGTPSDDVFPGYTEGACFVTDSHNDLWLISGYNDNGNTDTVWRYNIETLQWTFIYGDVNAPVIPTYDANPVYGGKWCVSCDIDTDDVVWLFGGWGESPDGNTQDDYNDVWSFDTTSGTYNLEFGSAASYMATPKIASEDFHPDNHPPAKELAAFIDRRDGTLMLAGSGGYYSADNWGGMNDVWLFNKTNKQWKFVYGTADSADIPSEYTNYRTAGSVMGGQAYRSNAHGLNTGGDLFIVGGYGLTVSANFLKDIWLISNDQCTVDNDKCSPGGTCIEQMIGYTCECSDGYTFDGTTCMDIDECAENTDSCKDGEECVNTDGSYECIQSPASSPVSSPVNAPGTTPQGQASSSVIVSVNVLLLSLALFV